MHAADRATRAAGHRRREHRRRPGDPLGNVYEADDTAEVRVIAPAIHLDKSVSDDLVPAGTTVDYDFAVTNVGQQPDRRRRRPR